MGMGAGEAIWVWVGGGGKGRLLERLRVTRRILRKDDGAGEVGGLPGGLQGIVKDVLQVIQVGHAGRDVAGQYEEDLWCVCGCVWL